MNIICELDPEELENERIRELEREWHKTLPKLTETFLLKAFGDALETMDDKIDELKAMRAAYLLHIHAFSRRYVVGDDVGSCFARMCIKHFLIKPLFEIEKSYFKLERLRHKKTLPKNLNNKTLTSWDIERARNVDLHLIAESYLENLKKRGRNYAAKCPWHEDKSPSFYIYTESNRFYCFGCTASGDTIAFVQKTAGLSFREAIYYLIQK